MKILITGSLGAVGRNIYLNALKPTRKEMDITDYLQVREYLRSTKPEVIIHLASIVGGECDKDKVKAIKTNVEATDNLYRMGLDVGVKKFIFLSSSAVYHQRELKPTKENENIDPKTFYGETKLRAEQKLIHGRALILRVFNIYGRNFQSSLINRLVAQEQMEIRSPDHFWRDYIHIGQVADIIQEAVYNEALGEVNLGTGVARNTSQVIGFLNSVGIFPDYKVVRGEQSITWADTSKLKQLFNKVPISDIILL
jgi:nucleoside-diphosphate-sugar epimerase